jgi:hypothetical protein
VPDGPRNDFGSAKPESRGWSSCPEGLFAGNESEATGGRLLPKTHGSALAFELSVKRKIINIETSAFRVSGFHSRHDLYPFDFRPGTDHPGIGVGRVGTVMLSVLRVRGPLGPAERGRMAPSRRLWVEVEGAAPAWSAAGTARKIATKQSRKIISKVTRLKLASPNFRPT